MLTLRAETEVATKEEDRGDVAEENTEHKRRLAARQVTAELFYFHRYSPERNPNLLARLLKLTPESADAFYFQGLDRYRSGKRGEAIVFLQRAVQTAPDHDTAWNFLGSLYLYADRPHDGVEAFRRATQAAPYNAQYVYNLASTLVRTGQKNSALEYSRRAIALKENFAEAYALQARLLDELKFPERALAAYERALHFGLRSVPFLLSYLELAEALNHERKVLELLKLLPGNSDPEVLRTQARIRLGYGEYAVALELFGKLVSYSTATYKDKKRYIYAAFKAHANVYKKLAGLELEANDRSNLEIYLRYLVDLRNKWPEIRNPHVER